MSVKPILKGKIFYQGKLYKNKKLFKKWKLKWGVLELRNNEIMLTYYHVNIISLFQKFKINSINIQKKKIKHFKMKKIY